MKMKMKMKKPLHRGICVYIYLNRLYRIVLLNSQRNVCFCFFFLAFSLPPPDFDNCILRLF